MFAQYGGCVTGYRKIEGVHNRIVLGFSRVENLIGFKAITRGLTLTIPILLVGSFCLILLNLPIEAYQNAVMGFPLFREFLRSIHGVTLGAYSLYAVISVSFSYAQSYAEKNGDLFIYGAPFAGLGAYLLLIGMGSADFSISVLRTRSLFIALISGLISSALYCFMMNRSRTRKKSYGSTTDGFFNRAIKAITPIVLIVVGAAIINTFVGILSHTSSLEELLFRGISDWFPSETASLGSGLLYVFLNNILWFFGLHGANMLSGVADNVFVAGTEINAQLIAGGMLPSEVITKTSLDVFVSIGGAGALLSLLIVVLAFGKRENIKKLSGMASVPMLFNINEIMLFGLPVIWNPTMLIPFILVPIVNLFILYGATIGGFVPYVSVDVSWITPPLVGGYIATGSFAGVILQAVNLLVGALIYLPFLRMYEANLESTELNEYQNLLSRFQQAECERKRLNLITLPGAAGLVAQALADDLRRAVNEGSFDLHYQPQFDIYDKGIGAEALLRWEHSTHGVIYPPLIVKLAEESGLLEELEQAVFDRALDDAKKIQNLSATGIIDPNFAISVNATARALQDEKFVNRVIEGVKHRALDPGRLILEATEHDALAFNDRTRCFLERLVSAKIHLAIDDFSMGHTSFRYLETSAFSIVKLDGSIARGVMANMRYAEIVSSITNLSEQLSFKVLAEYVESREQRDVLESLGCSYFQGYYYCPAVPFNEMVKRVSLDSLLLNQE